MSQTTRPTKKQRQVLVFIEQFIAQHGYSPSYREIKDGLGYASVAGVSLHVNNLIKRGHLQKRHYSARSLEVVGKDGPISALATNQVLPAEEKWLVEKVEQLFSLAEDGNPSQRSIDNLYVLIGALKVLGVDGAAQSFISRLSQLKSQPTTASSTKPDRRNDK
jgi:repressor LexA